MSVPSVLVVDDQADMANGIAMLVGELPAEVRTANNVDQALELLEEHHFDLAISDIRMPGRGGMDLLAMIMQRWSHTRVIMITAFGSIDSAVEAMRRGAWDYVTKPFDNEQFVDVVRYALGKAESETGSERDNPVFEGIVSKDPTMSAQFDVMSKVAPSDVSVLVCGEHGTGKELVARAIHRLSGRTGPFVAFAAGALPDTLAEAELFGCKKGAFTGATTDRKGYFVTASEGTLFIDEVATMSPALQVKLLRALQEREVIPVGSTEAVPTRARIVAATNVDLLAMGRDGSFRNDLYYRLSAVRVTLPPLRDRAGDIPLLAEHLLRQRCLAHGVATKRLSPRAIRALQMRDWPGNVRELQNLIDRLVLLAPDEVIEPDAVLFDQDPDEMAASSNDESYEDAKRRVLEQFQRQFIDRLMAETDGNIAEASRKAGITRASLYRMMKRLDPGKG